MSVAAMRPEHNNIARTITPFLQQLAVKLAHYASEMGNAYSEDPPGETMVAYRVQQAKERVTWVNVIATRCR
jgi:hypothetical protein